jgi:enterochelin esterase-like enzyme
MSESQIKIEKFDSQVLVGNPLGDPTLRKVPVYLPPDYNAETRYPVVYLLTAYAARGLKLLKDELFGENIQDQLDRLITTQEIQPIIVVMPDSSTRLGGSQYLNSSAIGNYEDHLLELVTYIDNKYPTIAEKGHRAVSGHSSGGYGALRMGMRQPETFGLVACHSGDAYFDMVYRPDFPKFLQFHDRAGDQGVRDLLTNPGEMLRKGTSFYALAVLAMASCYSPNPEAEWGFDLPFELYTGELRPDVWLRWLANDPVQMVEKHQTALQSLRLLFIDCGNRDEEYLVYGARILDNKMTQLEVPHQYEEYDWGHRNIEFRYDVSFKAFSEKFD